MIAIAAVTIGLPTVFLVIRLLAHLFDPKSYAPAGGYDIFTALVAGVLYIFGFIMAATLGCTAGSADLGDGEFRHLVITGRSRLAIYLARIPAGLSIVLSLIAIGYAIVCIVCCFAAPTTINYNGATVPANLSRTAFVAWAGDHPDEVLCNLPYNFPVNFPVPCGPGGPVTKEGIGPGASGPAPKAPTKAELAGTARRIAAQDYPGYAKLFLSPSNWLMIRTGAWVELEATVGFIVGSGLASLIGQRTVAVILMIVLEIILTPIFSRASIPHFINLQRGLVGLAVDHLEPGGLPVALSGGGGSNAVSVLVSETRVEAICVIIGWLVVWTAVGAWRMATRDA